LIDWHAGIRAELVRVFGDDRADAQLARYHELEPELQSTGQLSYRDVMTEAMRHLGAPDGEEEGLAESLPSWAPFPEVAPALEDLWRRGWQLAILSNSDRDLIAASKDRLGVPFDQTVVAQEIRSYKPAFRHWEEFSSWSGADPQRHVHVAASLFHDIVPASALGLPTVWINRLGETASRVRPTRELPDLSDLPDVLDELLPE
jgi:2-haloacid dehalogenase